MLKNEERTQLSKRESHMDFGGEVLGRCYHVFETPYGLDNHKDYIWESDEEMQQRYDRFEELEWEEQYKKKCQKMIDEKNK